MKNRLAIGKLFPESYQLMRQLDSLVKASGIDPLHLEMIKIRASQINGCAYCMDKHTGDAVKLGENPRRMYVLSGWREAADWFSEEEKAILQLTEEITHIDRGGISDEVYDKALELFGETKLAVLIMAAISINSWNRIGVGLKMQPVK